MKDAIRLFYWSEIKFIHKDKENYGDLLSVYIVEKITGKPVKWVYPRKLKWFSRKKRNFLAIGSIIHHASKHSVVWGSGIIDRTQEVAKADFKAVRGPKTREFLLNKGYDCPETYGDPAILLPNLFRPGITKKFKVGIIPHYHDYERVLEFYKDEKDILVIDLMTLDIEDVTQKILRCERTISSSLHGIIVSHAYGIPSVWVKFSNKIFGDDIKYLDYLESVSLNPYEPTFIDQKLPLNELDRLLDKVENLPEEKIMNDLQKSLMQVCPF